MRKYYWYFTAYLRKHGPILFGSILVAVAIFSLIIPTLVRTLEFKKRTYVGLVGEYGLDTLPLEITSLISSGLTRIEPDSSVVPNIASRISIENNNQTYRFVIHKDLKWQDGKTLTPEDIKYELKDTESIATKNDILFKLPAAFAPFPSVVSKPLLREETVKHNFFLNRPTLIGIGEYKITDYQTKDSYLKEITLDSPQERRIYRFYFSENDLILAFKRGEIDVIPDLSNPRDFESWNNTTVTKTLKTNRYLGLFFDNNKPIFSKNIRQALSYSLHKATDETRAVGPINPQSWAYLEGGKNYEYDLNRAIERATDELPAQPLSFELTTTSEFQEDAENIKKEWLEFSQKAQEYCQDNKEVKDKTQCKNLEMEINIKITNFPDLYNFDVLLIGQEIPVDPDQYALWHSDQATNFTNYKNTRIDSLLEKGRTTVDQTTRTEIYQEFQQFFLEDAPAVFLRYLYSYEIRR